MLQWRTMKMKMIGRYKICVHLFPAKKISSNHVWFIILNVKFNTYLYPWIKMWTSFIIELIKKKKLKKLLYSAQYLK